jgi:hypothetical protein
LWFILQFVPGFYAFRFLIYVWMFYPRAKNGATTIFKAIHPYLLEIKRKAESTLAELEKAKRM